MEGRGCSRLGGFSCRHGAADTPPCACKRGSKGASCTPAPLHAAPPKPPPPDLPLLGSPLRCPTTPTSTPPRTHCCVQVGQQVVRQQRELALGHARPSRRQRHQHAARRVGCCRNRQRGSVGLGAGRARAARVWGRQSLEAGRPGRAGRSAPAGSAALGARCSAVPCWAALR